MCKSNLPFSAAVFSMISIISIHVRCIVENFTIFITTAIKASDIKILLAQMHYFFTCQIPPPPTPTKPNSIKYSFNGNNCAVGDNVLIFFPKCARTRIFFPPYFSYPFCRFSIFVFFFAFSLVFSTFFHENEGVHCLC